MTQEQWDAEKKALEDKNHSLALQLVVVREAANMAYHAIRSHCSVYPSCRGAVGTMNQYEHHLQRGHDALEKVLSTPPPTLVAQMEKKLQIAGKIQGLLEIIQAWIKKSHHHDGCVRRYQPYPQRKDRDICDCRRVYILGEIEQTLALWNEANTILSRQSCK